MLAGCPGRVQCATYTEAGLCSEPLATLPALALGTWPALCPVPRPLCFPEHPVPPRSDFSFPSGTPPGTWARVPRSAAPPLRPMDPCVRAPRTASSQWSWRGPEACGPPLFPEQGALRKGAPAPWPWAASFTPTEPGCPQTRVSQPDGQREGVHMCAPKPSRDPK